MNIWDFFLLQAAIFIGAFAGSFLMRLMLGG